MTMLRLALTRLVEIVGSGLVRRRLLGVMAASVALVTVATGPALAVGDSGRPAPPAAAGPTVTGPATTVTSTQVPTGGSPDPSLPDATPATWAPPDTTPQPPAAPEDDESAPAPQALGDEELAPATEAGTIIPVTTTRDVVDASDGVVSLREAVVAADRRPGPDTVLLVSGAIYRLTQPCPGNSLREDASTADLDHGSAAPLVVIGPGATVSQTTECRYGEARVLDAGGPLTLVGVTITGGHSIDPCAGAIGSGALTCRATYPMSGPGGGVRAEGAVLLVATTIVGNEAERSGGGGVWSYRGLRAVASTIVGNRAWAGGGLASPTAVAVEGSTVRNNTVTPGVHGHGVGGGIWSAGSVSIADSTVAANVGRIGAGAFASAGLVAQRSTVTGNRARPVHVVGGAGFPTATYAAAGGGLATFGHLDVRNATVTDNRVRSWAASGDGWISAPGYGGGLWSGAALSLIHATVAGNGAASGSNLMAHGPFRSFASAIGAGRTGTTSCDLRSRTDSRGHNVVVGGRCRLGAGPGDVVRVASLGLGPLGDHGGPTPTRVPVGARLSIVPVGECTRTSVDQRGRHRPAGAACETGAVEVP